MQSIDFSSAKNHEDLLAEALRAAGYNVSVYGKTIYGKTIQFSKGSVSGSYSNGRFSATEGFDVDEVKRNFGKQALKAAGRKFGWDLITDPSGKMKLRKRI